MRVWLLFLIVLFLDIPTSGENPLDRYPPGMAVKAERVALDPRDPARVRVGELTYLGGVRLTGRHPMFGGFSAMTVEGDRFTLLSDAGNILRFRMGKDFQLREVSSGSLCAGPGTGWLKRDRDSESLTRDPATGQFWVGFEQYSAIWRYDAQGCAQAHAQPAAMADWSENGGPEAMVRLRSGAFLAISEVTRPKGNRQARDAIRFAGDPTAARVRFFHWAYLPPEDYDPTDMVELPDGRLLVLNRRATFQDMFTAKLVIVDPRAIRPGAAVAGRELATLAAPVLHDNYEALAITREGKDVILWVASDDNQMWFEQSLVLKFRLEMR